MQEINQTITRARRNTIGDALRRSAARNPIEAVSAVIVPKEDADGENLREELEEHAREKLADYKRPKHIFFVEDLPRNAAGKILKRELREEFADRVVSRWE